MRSSCSLCVHTNIFSSCVFVAAGTCLTRRCLAMVVHYGSTTAAFRCHVTLRSKVVERGVFNEVGSYQILSM
jgi:hypothetical protein